MKKTLKGAGERGEASRVSKVFPDSCRKD
jgi:hypothetical protein